MATRCSGMCLIFRDGCAGERRAAAKTAKVAKAAKAGGRGERGSGESFRTMRLSGW
ncbi:hypothetical protein GCM10009838_00340 [Catenulispora subtropica]|uniref:Uncharacterized protein n=1 Tax=Catenulispora subtropica TaxID=450798 RepID=A0ABN2QBU3_9ACTN